MGDDLHRAMVSHWHSDFTGCHDRRAATHEELCRFARRGAHQLKPLRLIRFRPSYLPMFCLIPLLISACTNIDLRETVNLDGRALHVAINDIQYRDQPHASTWVYGTLTVENPDDTIRSINLTCLEISFGHYAGFSVYVDTIASTSSHNYRLGPGRTTIPVYWVADYLPNRHDFPGKLDVHLRNYCPVLIAK